MEYADVEIGDRVEHCQGDWTGTVQGFCGSLIQIKRDDGIEGWCKGLWTTDPKCLDFISSKAEKPIEITKQKADKPEYGRLLEHVPNALLAAVAVRKYGNDKYAAIAGKAGVPFDSESWKENPARDYLESAMRHVAALFRGERINAEDGGCHHAAQAIIDLCFFFEIEKAEQEFATESVAPK